MKKRIFRNMALLTTAALLLATALLCALFYYTVAANARDAVRTRAELFRGASLTDDANLFAAIDPDDMRLTVIAPGGAVLYDNAVEPAALENHADREEIQQAFLSGAGESRRMSDTLSEETWYYALKLPDGNVLRAALTEDSLYALFARVLPAALLVLAAAALGGYLAAGRLTRRIIAPINGVALSEDFTPPYDELAPFARTIARQRALIAEQVAELTERAATITAMMESMGEGAALMDGRGVVVSANRAALSIFGRTESMAGRDVIELLRDVDLYEQAMRALKGERSEATLRRAGRVYQAYFSPAGEQGAILLFLDTTEKTEAEALRREFSANVSHELKTPLTSISGYAEMLAAGAVQEADRDNFIQKIRDESARMIALVEDILWLSQLDEQRMDPPAEAVDLAGIISEAMGALSQKAEERGVALRIKGEGTVRANPSQMYELFFNLIDNAIAYNVPGGEVAVLLRADENGLTATVRDTGIGIPPEAQPRVFDRFYRVDKSRSKKSGGTGLGLAIVKHIARLNGARLSLTSTPGVGTAVEVGFEERL
ncbi:MAG: PAS domain-containing protein [Oscillospiraceae bacterium]|jgi:two-component system phosphate regulon sensor histidine kinase PhoR|nr:PAS domain-containing protein [Oscillospiraceae bacterium]